MSGPARPVGAGMLLLSASCSSGGADEGGTSFMRWMRECDPGHVAIAMLLIVGSGIALTVDVVTSGFGVKGDEATYVSMALSVAYDGDLAYERRDLERFYEIYGAAPEGLFLKPGSRWAVESDRLYFGKAYVHAPRCGAVRAAGRPQRPAAAERRPAGVHPPRRLSVSGRPVLARHRTPLCARVLRDFDRPAVCSAVDAGDLQRRDGLSGVLLLVLQGSSTAGDRATRPSAPRSGLRRHRGRAAGAGDLLETVESSADCPAGTLVVVAAAGSSRLDRRRALWLGGRGVPSA